MDQTWTSSELAVASAVAPTHGPISWGGVRLRALAEIYLRAVAIGAPASELAETLASAVLGSELVRLARAVLEGTEFRTARATELAARIFDAAGSVASITAAEGERGTALLKGISSF